MKNISTSVISCDEMKLEELKSPVQLKEITNGKLDSLAKEIRQKIIKTVAETGGHLASNLGITELTIALHKVYDSPIDKFIFDVGHQCYPHKLLTGRYEMFDTLRKTGGMSGYPHPSESPHDHYHTGHASTALSLATGEVLARKLMGKNHHVVGIVGDGSLTGGESFEALNHLGSLGENVLVILNDNQMSISPSVGALSLLTNKFRASLTYRAVSRNIGNFLSKLGGFGEWIVGLGIRIKSALKRILMKNQYFEQLGFRYYGPIDGHNIGLMVAFLKRIKMMKGPILLHVITKKGKGYKYAEDGPTEFHGTPPFEKGNGHKEKSSRSYSKVFGESLTALMEKDDRIVAISSAMVEGTGLSIPKEKFPKRVIDVGIAEPHSVSLACGLANAGMKPVVALYSTFLQRSFDQIIHDVSLMKQPVVFAIDRAGVVPGDGPTHQGIFDLSYLSMIPDMTIMAPSTSSELDEMLKLAFSLESPCAIRYPRDKSNETDEPAEVRLFKAKKERSGENVLICYIGALSLQVHAAALLLSQIGIECEVLNLRFAKPIDWESVKNSANGKKLVITVEDGIISGGVGEKIKAELTDTKVVNIGVNDEIPPVGTRSELLARYNLDSAGIAKVIQENV
ncbi:MAG: 1-deoxy-D-xylulose-5-phosphate synthase [Caldisericia bacterium]